LYHAFSYAVTFFILGLIAGDAPTTWKFWFRQKRWWLSTLTVIFFVAQLLEFALIGLATGNINSASANEKITSIIFAGLLILMFLSSDWHTVRLPKLARYIANTSMGIYVVHEPLMSYLFQAINSPLKFNINAVSIFWTVPFLMFVTTIIAVLFLETVKQLAR
jgi:peptidoglycan/LPS O-acetylase OafA/YrhL